MDNLTDTLLTLICLIIFVVLFFITEKPLRLGVEKLLKVKIKVGYKGGWHIKGNLGKSILANFIKALMIAALLIISALPIIIYKLV